MNPQIDFNDLICFHKFTAKLPWKQITLHVFLGRPGNGQSAPRTGRAGSAGVERTLIPSVNICMAEFTGSGSHHINTVGLAGKTLISAGGWGWRGYLQMSEVADRMNYIEANGKHSRK